MKSQIPLTPYSKFIRDFCVKYLRNSKHGSSKTIEAYKVGLKHFMRWNSESNNISINNIFFENLGYDTFIDFRNEMSDRGYSTRSCNLYLAANKSYINYCASKDVTLQSIAYSVCKVPAFRIEIKPQSHIDNEDALAILLDSPKCDYHGIRDRTILSCLFDGALRGNELVSILYGDISWDEEVNVLIHGKGHKERRIWFSPECKALMINYRTMFHSDSDPLCPFFYTVISGKKKAMTTRNLQRIVDVYSKKTRDILSMKYGSKSESMLPSKITPHTLRRTRATLLLRDGGSLEDISVFLGHASIETTRKHYAFLSEEQKKKLAKKNNNALPTVEDTGQTQTKLWNTGDELTDLFDF